MDISISKRDADGGEPAVAGAPLNPERREGGSEKGSPTEAKGKPQGSSGSATGRSPLEVQGLGHKLDQLSLRKKNRCGAAKKRARRAALLASSQGSPSGGLEGVTGSSLSTPLGGKRKKGSDDTPSDKVVKRKALTHQGLSYAEISDTARVRVLVAEGYPDACLTPLELCALRMSINKEIDALPVGQRMPRFEGVSLKAGAIVVQAADEWSRDWFVEKAPEWRLREGLQTSVKDVSVLQRYCKATAMVPGNPEDPLSFCGDSKSRTLLSRPSLGEFTGGTKCLARATWAGYLWLPSRKATSEH